MKKVIRAAALLIVAGAIILFVVMNYDSISSVWKFADQDTVTIFVGDQSFTVSVADTPEERRQGLSGTEQLPEFVGKLFIFDEDERHGIWMKDMNYAIDILWFSADRQIVHIEENVQPDTYTDSRTIFRSPEPARYVLEVVAGTVDALNIVYSDTLTVPAPLQREAGVLE